MEDIRVARDIALKEVGESAAWTQNDRGVFAIAKAIVWAAFILVAGRRDG